MYLLHTSTIKLPLQQRELITKRSIATLDELPRHFLLIVNSKLAEAKVPLVQHIGKVELLLIVAQHAVTLNIASHTVDNVRHRHARVGIVSVLVLDRGHVDSAVAHWKHALVPVDMAGEIGIDAVLLLEDKGMIMIPLYLGET